VFWQLHDTICAIDGWVEITACTSGSTVARPIAAHKTQL